jgi:autotransporter-associated beta strand protein
MKRTKRKLCRASFVIALALFSAPIASAQPVYWDSDGNAANNDVLTGAGLGGTGTWDSGLKWYNGTTDTAYVPNSNVVFTGATGVVSVTAPQIVASMQFKTTGYLVSGSSLTLTGPTVATDAGVDAAIGSSIIGVAGLTKTGSGVMTLSGASAYSGGTTVSGGTLAINGSITGSAVVQNGATLAGAGSVGGTIIVHTGAHVSPGSSAGTLTTNDLAMMSGSFLHAEMDTTSDKVVVVANLAVNGTLDVTMLNSFAPGLGQTFTLMTAGAITGTFATETLPTFSFRTFDVIYNPQSILLKVIPVLPGDYNSNGTVDGPDYVVWRKGLGTTFTQLDYDVWRANFGQSVGPGASLGAATVPEPAAFTVLGISAGLFLLKRRSWR